MSVVNKAIYLPGTGKHGLGQVNIPLQCRHGRDLNSLHSNPTTGALL